MKVNLGRGLAILVVLLTISFVRSGFGQESEPTQVLFRNVSVFDGESAKLTKNQDVLVEGKLIKSIGNDLVAGSSATVIDGGGRTLMPGLIDMHSHLAFSASSMVELENSAWEALGARTALVAEDTIE